MIAKQVLNFGVNRAVLRDLLAPSVLVPPRRLPPSRAHGSPAQPRHLSPGASSFLLGLQEYLDTGNPKEREHAAAILLSICSHSIEDCLLVMKEGVIPALVDLSVNGVDEAKSCPVKLLHLLRLR